MISAVTYALLASTIVGLLGILLQQGHTSIGVTLPETNDTSPLTVVGSHLIVEVQEVAYPDLLSNVTYLREMLLEAALVGNFTIIGKPMIHAFSPHGATGILLLAESHVSIHTWPEHRYAAVDVFTCGQWNSPRASVESIQKALKAGKVEVKSLRRGFG